MIFKASATLYSFLTRVSGLECYEENSVPDNAVLPYITYTLNVADFRESSSISVGIWYGGTDLATVMRKADEIGDAIGDGLRLPVEGGGCLWLNKETPFAQTVATQNDNVKTVTLNLGLQTIC